MAGGRGLWAPRFVCIVLYFYLCFTYYSSQKSKQHQNKTFYASSISSRPRIETYGYQTRNSRATRSNGLVLNSTRALLGCRLMLNASIWLLLIQLANDAELQPSPSQAQSLNDPRICQYLASLLATMKYTWCAYLSPPFTSINHCDLLKNLT